MLYKVIEIPDDTTTLIKYDGRAPATSGTTPLNLPDPTYIAPSATPYLVHQTLRQPALLLQHYRGTALFIFVLGSDQNRHMRSKPNCNQEGGGGAEMYSCHRTNNRRIKSRPNLRVGERAAVSTGEDRADGPNGNVQAEQRPQRKQTTAQRHEARSRTIR